MNRRVFLKGLALAALAATGAGLHQTSAAQTPAVRVARASSARTSFASASPAAQPAPVSQRLILGRLLRGTPDGQVQESLDGGATWRKLADFGSHVSIAQLYEQQSEIHAQMFLQGHSFTLRSPDGRLWWTAGARRPA